MKKIISKRKIFHSQNSQFVSLLLIIFSIAIPLVVWKSSSRIASPNSAGKSLSPSSTPPPAEGLKFEKLQTNPTQATLEMTSSLKAPRKIIDISDWATYQNSELRLSFRYPSAWGTPTTTLSSCSVEESCSSDQSPAYFFRLEFPQSSFTVGGGSKNFAPARGINTLYDFNGSDVYTQDKVCQKPWIIFCQQHLDRMDYLSIPACRGEAGSGFGYERVMLVNIPEGKLGGLAFGGEFIPEDYRPSMSLSCDDQIKDDIAAAIIDRRLKEEVVDSFDTFEKVFETVMIGQPDRL